MEPGMDPRVAGGETRVDAKEEFDTHVAARRTAAGANGDALGSWGLALSGGGIRSATFCLGLVRGLAKTGLLKPFDYLSTVSGGGYLGASLDRFETLLRRLNLKCNEQADEAVRGECMALHQSLGGLLVKDPDPFYDYWFRDKCEACAVAHALPEGAVCGGGIPPPRRGWRWPTQPVRARRWPWPNRCRRRGLYGCGGAGSRARAGRDPAAIISDRRGSSRASGHAPGRRVGARRHHVGRGLAAGGRGVRGFAGERCRAAPSCRSARCVRAGRAAVRSHLRRRQSYPCARALGEAVMASVGAGAAPVENVTASARRAGCSAPYAWPRTTLVYPAGTAEACVRRAREAVGAGLDAQRIRFGRPNSLELWIPPVPRRDGVAAE